MKKKTLSFLLCALLIISIVPGTVVAAGTECSGDCVHAAAIGSMHYDTLREAIDAASGKTEIKLLKNVTETNVRFTKSGTYTLDLGSYTLNTDAPKSDIIGLFAADLTLTIRNGKLTGKGQDTYGIYAYHDALRKKGYDNLNLTLDGVTIQSASQPLGVQGNNADQNITVKNCTLDSPDVGIYFPPKSGKLTIENSVIHAVSNGIVLKGGSLEILGENTVITATGTPKAQDKPYDGNTAGAGFPATGNAVYVEGGYKAENGTSPRPIDVHIEAGTFESTHAAAVAMNYLEDSKTQKTEITSGIFSSDVTRFVAEESISVGATSGEKTTYYIGASDAVVTAAEGTVGLSAVSVLKGDAVLDCLDTGVTVKNQGGGTVTVNGKAIAQNETVTVSNPAVSIGNKTYDTLADAYQAAKNGDVIKLLRNIYTDNKLLVADKAVTIDLNNHNLTASNGCAFQIENGGKLTLDGKGTIVAVGAIGRVVQMWGAENPTETVTSLTVGKDVTLSGNDGIIIFHHAGIKPGSYGAEVTVNGTVTAANSGIFVSGNITKTDGTGIPKVAIGSTAKIGDGKTSTALAINGYAEVTVADGAEITGVTGIEVRAGKLTVNGGTVTGGTGDILITPQASGNTAKNVGLAISQHVTALPITVIVNGGTISGSAAVYESNPEKNAADVIAKVDIAVNGGSFTGLIYSEDETGFISGGTFDKALEDAYLAEGFAPVQNTDGSYTVAKPHTHKGTLVPGKAATCTQDGVKAYYACTCGKNFEDAACTKEITDPEQWKVIKAAGHTDADKNGKCDVCGAAIDAKPIVPEVPLTGDGSNPVFWLVLMAVSLAVIGGSVLYGRKKKITK